MKFELFGKKWDTEKTYYYAGYLMSTSWFPFKYHFHPDDKRNANNIHYLTEKGSFFGTEPKWVRVKISEIIFDGNKKENPVCDIRFRPLSSSYDRYSKDLRLRNGIILSKPRKEEEILNNEIERIRRIWR